MRITIALVTLVSLSSAAFAGQVTVQSSIDCAQWEISRKSNRSAVFESFFIGLVNGLSVGSGTEFWNAEPAELTRDQALLWLDKYCDKNPLSDIYRGTISLINEHTGGSYERRVSRQTN